MAPEAAELQEHRAIVELEVVVFDPSMPNNEALFSDILPLFQDSFGEIDIELHRSLTRNFGTDSRVVSVSFSDGSLIATATLVVVYKGIKDYGELRDGIDRIREDFLSVIQRIARRFPDATAVENREPRIYHDGEFGPSQVDRRFDPAVAFLMASNTLLTLALGATTLVLALK